MKNIIFDFGNVLLKIGTVQDFVENLDCIKNLEKFCEENEKIILQSHMDNNIDFLDIIINNSDKWKKTRLQMFEKSCEPANNTLLVQIPELSEKYKLYILSDITKNFIPFFLKKHDIEKYFSWIIESCNIWYLKPNDEIYKALLEKYNLKPKESVFFDDKQKNIDWAEKNGIRWILFDDFEMNIEEKLKKL